MQRRGFSIGVGMINACRSKKKWPILLTANEVAVLQNKINVLNRGFQDLEKFSNFNIDNVTYGFLQPSFVTILEQYKDVFSIQEGKEEKKNSGSRRRVVDLSSTLLQCSLKDRSAAVAEVLCDLRKKGVVRGWRDELFPVVKEFGDREPALLIERACYPWFGIRGYGLHVNGYTVHAGEGRESDAVSNYWVAKRSMSKSQYPGALDSLVAGAIPFGVSSLDNLVKEAFEEARIPPELTNKYMRPAGAINYVDKDDDGNLKRDFLLCFDFNTPEWFKPEPNDGEVESFRMMPIEWVLQEILKVDDSSGYKPNCVIIVVDFLIRQGIISPDSPGYFKLLGSLRGFDCA